MRTFVAQHQCHGKEPELAPYLAFHPRIQSLEPVDEHQGQENHVLGNLSHRKYSSYPFSEASCRHRFRDKRGCWVGHNCCIFDKMKGNRGLEPEKAGYLLRIQYGVV